MITLNINRETLELQQNESLTLGQAIQLIEQEGIQSNEAVTSVTIAGNRYHVETLGELANEDIDNLGDPVIEIKTNYEIAFEALTDCNGYIDTITAKIKEVVDYYNENDLDSANMHFSELIDLVDLFIQLISKVHRTVKTFNPDFFKDNDTVRNLEIHLLSILKALIPAKEKNDIIMLSDLLEYELADNLAQWKIKAIPLMLESKVD
jgi:hypothetical protein